MELFNFKFSQEEIYPGVNLADILDYAVENNQIKFLEFKGRKKALDFYNKRWRGPMDDENFVDPWNSKKNVDKLMDKLDAIDKKYKDHKLATFVKMVNLIKFCGFHFMQSVVFATENHDMAMFKDTKDLVKFVKEVLKVELSSDIFSTRTFIFDEYAAELKESGKFKELPEDLVEDPLGFSLKKVFSAKRNKK